MLNITLGNFTFSITPGDLDNYYTYYFSSYYPSWIQITFYVLISIIFLLGTFGNLITIYTIHCTCKEMKTVQNFFLSNLAAGDLLTGIIAPFIQIVSLLRYWPFGSIFCTASGYFQAVGVLISSFTLVALAADRYSAVIYPLKIRLSHTQARMVVLLIWLASLAMCIPVAITRRLKGFLTTYKCYEVSYFFHY